MKKISVILVDDHSMIRFGLKSFLEDDDIEVIGEAKNGVEALNLLESIKPDVLVTDIMMPEMDGIELTAQVTKKYPSLPILALSMMNENHNIKKMMNAGAKGYALKDCSQKELILAIKTVYEGRSYYTDEVTQIIMESLHSKPKPKERTVTGVSLTERELEILHLICKEKTNPEIADELFISTRTVEAHKRNLIEKTGCKNIAGLVLYAVERNLFDDL